MESSGSAWAWGRNYLGNLGLGVVGGPTTYNWLSSPTQIGTEVTWIAISGSMSFSAGIKNDGTLWTWGNDGNGRLGQNGTPVGASPEQVGTDTTWSNVSLGIDYPFAMATKTDGTLWTWGKNERGNLGQNQAFASPNNIGISSPMQVGTDTTWTDKITAGCQQAWAIKTDGTLWAWGYNEAPGNAVLGTSPGNVDRSSPTKIGTQTDWVFVKAGRFCCGGVRNTDDLFTWGNNTYGQLGLNNRTLYSSPKQIPGSWRSVSLTTKDGATADSGGIQADGTLWRWGGNLGGALGQGGGISPNSSPTRRSSPVQVGTDTNWNQMSSFNSNVAATKTDGSLWSWGYNDKGELGHNNRRPSNYSSPKQIPGTNWTTTTSRNQLSFRESYDDQASVFVLKNGGQ
tara:strand:- start:40 stop:1233 length:1194 start_codon:yes stop_codon:yes gene_type:complete